MLKACAHLGFQFNEFVGLDRIHQAAKAGFQAAEWPGIYEFDRSAFMQAVKQNKLVWPQVTLPLGNVQSGEKGITALPGRETEFRRDLDMAISYALELNASYIHPMSGINCGLDDEKNRSVYVSNLKLATQMAAKAGLKVLIEVISPTTVAGYAMGSYNTAQSIFDEVPNLHLLLDIYHAHLIEGDVCTTIKRWGSKIGHVQIADAPGRNEPGSGALDFAPISGALDSIGYSGWLGCEYKPASTTLDGLHHLRSKGWL